MSLATAMASSLPSGVSLSASGAAPCGRISHTAVSAPSSASFIRHAGTEGVDGADGPTTLVGRRDVDTGAMAGPRSRRWSPCGWCRSRRLPPAPGCRARSPRGRGGRRRALRHVRRQAEPHDLRVVHTGKAVEAGSGTVAAGVPLDGLDVVAGDVDHEVHRRNRGQEADVAGLAGAPLRPPRRTSERRPRWRCSDRESS